MYQWVITGEHYDLCCMLPFPTVTEVLMQGLQCLEEAVDVSEAHLYDCQSLLDVTEVSCVDHRPWSCHLTILLCYTGMANTVGPSPQDFICVCVHACVRVCVYARASPVSIRTCVPNLVAVRRSCQKRGL